MNFLTRRAAVGNRISSLTLHGYPHMDGDVVEAIKGAVNVFEGDGGYGDVVNDDEGSDEGEGSDEDGNGDEDRDSDEGEDSDEDEGSDEDDHWWEVHLNDKSLQS
jgi:hypothetical protein